MSEEQAEGIAGRLCMAAWLDAEREAIHDFLATAGLPGERLSEHRADRHADRPRLSGVDGRRRSFRELANDNVGGEPSR